MEGKLQTLECMRALAVAHSHVCVCVRVCIRIRKCIIGNCLLTDLTSHMGITHFLEIFDKFGISQMCAKLRSADRKRYRIEFCQKSQSKILRSFSPLI